MHATDAYLQPIVDKYGEHKGLNADWAVMAWLVTRQDGVADWWILDDESTEETVSLVVHTGTDDDGDPILATLLQGSVACVTWEHAP